MAIPLLSLHHFTLDDILQIGQLIEKLDTFKQDNEWIALSRISSSRIIHAPVLNEIWETVDCQLVNNEYWKW